MGWLSDVVSGVVNIGGAFIGSRENRRAADTASDAAIRAAEIEQEGSREARQEYRAAADRGVQAIRAGTQNYADIVAPLLYQSQDYSLRPHERIALEDLTRDANAYLATSGTRGAGRGGVASVFDMRRRYVADALGRREDINRATEEAARTNLGNIYAQQGGSIASTETGAGNQIGSTYATAGRAGGDAARYGGEAQANAGLANAQIWSGALGNIGAIIAADEKDRRLDPYENWRQRSV
jgi:hypothetical protein